MAKYLAVPGNLWTRPVTTKQIVQVHRAQKLKYLRLPHFISLRQKCCNFDKIFVTGCDPKFWKGRRFLQNYNISISVMILILYSHKIIWAVRWILPHVVVQRDTWLGSSWHIWLRLSCNRELRDPRGTQWSNLTGGHRAVTGNRDGTFISMG